MNDGFITLEGVLTEAGQFDLIRSVQQRRVDPSARFGQEDRMGGLRVEATLLNDKFDVLSKSWCPVHFPAGCEGHGQFGGAGLVRAAMAWHPHARFVRLTYNGAVVFSDQICDEPPQLALKALRANTKNATVLLDVSACASVTIWAQVANGTRLRPPARAKGSAIIVDLTSLAGLEKAELFAQATDGHRSAEISCGIVELAPAKVVARIVEPAHEADVPFGKRINLIATLSDQNGRKIEWCAKTYAWRINGNVLTKTNAQMVAQSMNDAGKTHIELLSNQNAKLKAQVLASATVIVRAPSNAQQEFLDLMEQRALTS